MEKVEYLLDTAGYNNRVWLESRQKDHWVYRENTAAW